MRLPPESAEVIHPESKGVSKNAALALTRLEEIDAAFSTIARERADALFLLADSFFATRRVHLAILATRHAVPAAYGQRDYAEAGGLMSYGTNLADARPQVGVYTGRILKGEKPAP